MEKYKQEFSKVLADSGSLFFDEGLCLKDGRPTPYFVNIGCFAEKASLRWELAKAYAGMIKKNIDGGIKIDVVFGPSYKASLIAGDVTLALLHEYDIDLGCCYDRKEAKTHGEASSKKGMFVGAKFFDGCKIYLVDDVGTSMATKVEAREKIESEANAQGIKTEMVGIGISVDREQVGPVYDESKPEDLPNKERVILDKRGEDAIGKFVKETGIPVDSIVAIREVVEYLYKEKYPLMINGEKKPMDEETYNKFQEYMKTYGAER